MTRDFTYEKYRELCQVILESGYRIVTVEEFLEKRNILHEKTVILRHDVDRRIRNAYFMAGTEQSLGIRSSYYFRYPHTFKPDVIAEIRNMGHEIGYHYETLSKTGGDHRKALVLFENELAMFRQISPIRTICVHGSPLSKYHSLDLWKDRSFNDFGLLGDAFLSMGGTRYFTDTGREWSGKHSLRDMMPAMTDDISASPVETTDDLMDFIRTGKETPLYITAHPERWARNSLEWVVWTFADTMMNAGKVVIRSLRR